jgi:antitoxin VapB
MYILAYVQVDHGATMKTAKVFKSGNSQAVRIPKEFHLEGEEVEIRKRGGSLVLSPRKKSWAALIDSLKKFSDDFMEQGRHQPPAQNRGRAF